MPRHWPPPAFCIGKSAPVRRHLTWRQALELRKCCWGVSARGKTLVSSKRVCTRGVGCAGTTGCCLSLSESVLVQGSAEALGALCSLGCRGTPPCQVWERCGSCQAERGMVGWPRSFGRHEVKDRLCHCLLCSGLHLCALKRQNSGFLRFF